MSSTPGVNLIAADICFAKNFKLVSYRGFGAFKDTFHIKDNATSQSYALKILKDNPDLNRLKREIQAQSSCNHKSIAKFHAAETIHSQGKNVIYIVEEYLEGQSLKEKLVDSGQLSIPEGKDLALRMIEAIETLYIHRLVHRDIKPENIMFRSSGEPVLVDFGIVRALDSSSLTQTWQPQGPGTPIYSAPEQLVNDKNMIDWRCDQFSLGVTLSIAIMGLHPISQKPDYSDVVNNVINRNDPTDKFKDAVKKNNLSLLEKMVQCWPVRRYSKPGQLKTDWEKI